MSLPLERGKFFLRDFELQAEWYVRAAGDEGERIAARYLRALDATLARLCQRPDLGRVRHFTHPHLKGIRSFRVNPPFDRHLIFYRLHDTTLYAERIIHGMRDLPRRLLEPPEESND